MPGRTDSPTAAARADAELETRLLVFSHDSVRRIAEAGRAAESELKTAFAAVPDTDTVEEYLPALRAFALSLFDAEAAEALEVAQDRPAYERFLQYELSARIIEGILPDQGLAGVKWTWSGKVTIEQEIGSEIIFESRPDGTTTPARAEIQAGHAQHGDWERFAPEKVRFGLRLEKSASVREDLSQLLKRRGFYWLDRFSLRPGMPAQHINVNRLMTEARRETHHERFSSEEGGRMSQSPDWEQLADQLEKLKLVETLRAQWYAYVGIEDYGIWLLRPDGSGAAQVRSSFTLIAAQIIEKLRVPPIPVPEPLQHFPHWRDYCEAEEHLVRSAGGALDLSNAIPHGLGAIDLDAVDPCTRAFLEMLRRQDGAFQIESNGTDSIKGKTYRTVSGSIRDLYGAAAAYCKRLARDEIGARLASRLDDTPGTATFAQGIEHGESRSLALMPEVPAAPPFRAAAKDHPHVYVQWNSALKLWTLHDFPVDARGRPDQCKPIPAGPIPADSLRESATVAVGRLRASRDSRVRAAAETLRDRLNIWLDLMRINERGFRRIHQFTRWRGGKPMEEFLRSGTLPSDARLTENGSISHVFQESANFWDALVALGFESGSGATTSSAKPAHAGRGFASPAEPHEETFVATNQTAAPVVPEWASDLGTPQGRKTAREEWKRHWTTAERECTNDDLTEIAFSQRDRPFLNQWENGNVRLKDPTRSSRVQGIERVLRSNTPPKWHPAAKQTRA